MQTQHKSRDEIMHSIAALIVRYRFVIMLLFIVAAVYAGLSALLKNESYSYLLSVLKNFRRKNA